MAGKLCEICGKPVASDLEGSWGLDEEGRARYFHADCLRKKKSEYEAEVPESPLFVESHPFERARKAPYRP